jgi:hypothetical protein
MFNPLIAVFVIIIGVFVGYLLDGKRKKHDMELVGWMAFPFVCGAISIKYGASWGFLSLIELVAGLGLYVMFFHQMFEVGSVAGPKNIDSSGSNTESLFNNSQRKPFAKRDDSTYQFEKYKTDEKIVIPKNRKPIMPSASQADKKTVDRKAWVDLLKKNKK